MSGNHIEVQNRGQAVRATTVCIDGRTIAITGRWVRTAAVFDEWLMEHESVPAPALFTAHLRESGAHADLFTFAQRLPDVVPQHPYHLEWDSVAVIPITTYSDWLENRAASDVRAAVKKAVRLGVVVRSAEYDDALVRGIVDIFNESPTRQGKPFWHYQKDFETVKREVGTYLERSTYLGAYYNDQLIGFIKMVHVGKVAATLQVIGKKKYLNKKPMNALIAQAVEFCEARGMSHLVYGVYDPSAVSLTEFKRRNGFEQVLIPRYYMPLTLKGRIALALNLHRGVKRAIPEPLLHQLKKLRRIWTAHRAGSKA